MGQAGAKASGAACDAYESIGDDVCAECKASSSAPSQQRNFGGGRLGDGSGTGTQGTYPPVAQEPTAGERVSQAASTAGEAVSNAASAVGDSLSGAASWV